MKHRSERLSNLLSWRMRKPFATCGESQTVLMKTEWAQYSIRNTVVLKSKLVFLVNTSVKLRYFWVMNVWRPLTLMSDRQRVRCKTLFDASTFMRAIQSTTLLCQSATLLCQSATLFLMNNILYSSNKVLHSLRVPTLRFMGQDLLTKFYTFLLNGWFLLITVR